MMDYIHRFFESVTLKASSVIFRVSESIALTVDAKDKPDRVNAAYLQIGNITSVDIVPTWTAQRGHSCYMMVIETDDGNRVTVALSGETDGMPIIESREPEHPDMVNAETQIMGPQK